MEALQNRTAALVAVSLAATALGMLVGDKGVGRAFRLILACLFLLTVLSPLADGVTLAGTSPAPPSEGAEDAYTLRVLEGTVLRVCNQALENYGYAVKKAEVITDISEDGRISITEVILYADGRSYTERSAVTQLTRSRLGCETEVRRYDG